MIADAKDFKVEADRVNVVRADVFERDPVNLIRLFWVAERSNLPIHPNATRLVTQSLKRIDAELREDPRPTGCSWKSSPRATRRRRRCGG